MTLQPGNKKLQYTYCTTSLEVKTMKFGHLMEYNMNKKFLGKSNTNCDGETIPRSFSKLQTTFFYLI